MKQNAIPPVLRLVAFAFALILLFSACKEKTTDSLTDSTPDPEVKGCVACHTDYAKLRSIASPDTASSGGGCGGDAPHIEVYDRVYLGGTGYDAFKASTHGSMACTQCHGGDNETADKAVAHSGDFVRHPSLNAQQVCGGCHATQVSKHSNSLHAQGWGQKNMLVVRYGSADFGSLPASLKNGYDVNCGKCHASCGDCHVNRPVAGGGGLLRGHDFFRTPDMRENCTACHSSRGGHAYFGVAPGTVPDVHLGKLANGGHCINCHYADELHGNGQVYNQRYKYPSLPTCENCHSNLASKNTYHAVHLTTFNCQVCHSQDYNNCASCHVGGEGARIPSYQGFKIGMNPIPEAKPGFRFATVRRSLMAPDSWDKYGVATLSNFNAAPTYKYTTPHNIQRWTTRTQVDAGKSCYDNCHIIKEGEVYRNKNLYLFRSDLAPFEANANDNVVVDGKLPGSWGIN